MIQSIFLIKWEEFIDSNESQKDIALDQDTSLLLKFRKLRVAYSYPAENDTLTNKVALNNILDLLIKQIIESENRKSELTENYNSSLLIKEGNLFGFNLICCFIPKNLIFCFVFEDTDNLNDYLETLNENLNIYISKYLQNLNVEHDSIIETVLAALFVDLRIKGNILTEDSIVHLNDKRIKEKIENLYEKNTIKVYLYGIDSAGKSSLMRYLKTGKYDHNYFVPTKRFVIHKLTLPNRVKLVVWEMPGQKTFRRVWQRGIQGSDLIVFIMDAADKARYSEAKRAFWSIAERHEIKDKPILFLVNKVDLCENKTELSDIENFFDLYQLNDRKWVVKFTSLLTKEGIKESIDWVSETLNENFIAQFEDFS